VRIFDHKGTGVEDSQSRKLIEQATEPVMAICRIYPAGYRVAKHTHNKTQFWFSRRGVAIVSVSDGRWMVPPAHGLIIPAGLLHAAEMISNVEMHAPYVDADLAGADRPRVVEFTALAGNLVRELIEDDVRPLSPRREKLVMDLLLDEIGHLPERALGLPFPGDARLAVLCRSFLKKPDARAAIDDWAGKLGMSRRTFTRLFKAEMGVSFVTWRQQACVFASLPRLASGQPVTNVALDAGYENLAAFTTMFRRMLGSSPSTYIKAFR
jgi:AraC-like DNA-binding protein